MELMQKKITTMDCCGRNVFYEITKSQWGFAPTELCEINT
jgi:hypothetical protein